MRKQIETSKKKNQNQINFYLGNGVPLAVWLQGVDLASTLLLYSSRKKVQEDNLDAEKCTVQPELRKINAYLSPAIQD